MSIPFLVKGVPLFYNLEISKKAGASGLLLFNGKLLCNKPFVGGVPISIERLAISLRALGHTVYIFAPDYKSGIPDDEYTFRFPTTKKKIAGIVPVPSLVYKYIKDILLTLDVDFIHVHHPVMVGNIAIRLGKKFHIPVAFKYHTRYEQYLHYIKPLGYLQKKANEGYVFEKLLIDFIQQKFVQSYINHFIEKCDLIFAPTESIENYLSNFPIQTPICIAPTGLPSETFDVRSTAPEIRRKYLQDKRYLFCTVSRLAEEKNIPFMLQGIAAAKAQLGNIFNVVILGDGSERDNLIDLSHSLGIDENVFFLGEVPNEKIADYHQACDLFLFSSKSENTRHCTIRSYGCLSSYYCD